MGREKPLCKFLYIALKWSVVVCIKMIPQGKFAKKIAREKQNVISSSSLIFLYTTLHKEVFAENTAFSYYIISHKYIHFRLFTSDPESSIDRI